jgi:hypothetical protein
MPISKQRNKHLQSVLIEAAKLGLRLSPDPALIYDTEKQKGHANRALIVVAYLLAGGPQWTRIRSGRRKKSSDLKPLAEQAGSPKRGLPGPAFADWATELMLPSLHYTQEPCREAQSRGDEHA